MCPTLGVMRNRTSCCDKIEYTFHTVVFAFVRVSRSPKTTDGGYARMY